MTVLQHIQPVDRRTTGSSPRDILRGPLLVGLFGMLLTLAFSWVPSLWFDESATVSATSRTLPQLFEMLRHVDAVHGVYYVAMHLWFDLVGYSPFTLRLPSAVAVGVAAALIVVLVRTIGTPRLAVLSGIVFCLLPRVTWMGTEGRSYALTTVLVTSMTLLLVGALRRSTAPRRVQVIWWAAYAVVVVSFTTAFLYLALLVIAQGITVVISVLRSRAARSALVGWLASTAVAGLALLPFARLASEQSGQVKWIGPIDDQTWHGAFVAQWFLGNNTFAIFGWAAIVLGIVVLVLRRGRTDVASGALSMLLPWLIVPTVLLIAASLVTTPLYSARYLTFCAPAAAILMAVAIDALGRRRLIVVAVALCIVLTAPTYLRERGPHSKQASTWSEVASLFAQQRAAQPADTRNAIIWGPLRKHKDATSRVIEYSYPDAFRGTIDVKLKVPAAETGHLWETRYPLADVTSRMDDVPVVWLITSDKQDWRPSVTEKLAQLGYHLDTEWTFTGTNVLRYER